MKLIQQLPSVFYVSSMTRDCEKANRRKTLEWVTLAYCRCLDLRPPPIADQAKKEQGKYETLEYLQFRMYFSVGQLQASSDRKNVPGLEPDSSLLLYEGGRGH